MPESKNYPVMRLHGGTADPINEFYNKCHDENGRFCDGPDGADDSPEAIAAIDKQGRALARKYHKRQKYNGGDYVENHLKVAAEMLPARLRLAGWLHDTLEDTDATPESLRRDGVDPNTIRILKALTSPSGESKEKQLARVIRGGPDAIRVKLADTKSNYEGAKTIPADMIHPKKGVPMRDFLVKKYEGSIPILEQALEEAEKKRGA